MQKKDLRLRPVATLLLGFCTVATFADPIVLDAIDRGTYRNTGSFLDNSYSVGDPIKAQTAEFRSVVVFDLSGVTETIVSAKLRLFNGPMGFGSPDGTETLTIFDVQPGLANGGVGSGGITAFGDLGTGAVFGATVITEEDLDVFVEVNLNDTAVDALNATSEAFGVGCALTTLNQTTEDREQLFGFTTSEPLASTQLILSMELDSDHDSIVDVVDNCTLAANPQQRDTDADGIGNSCDADLNNDCIVNVVDLGLLRSRFFTGDPDADFNGDDIVNVVDLGIMRTLFFSAPGPSANSALCGRGISGSIL